MFRLIAAAAVLAAASPSAAQDGPAQADPTDAYFALFDRFCITTGGDPEAAVAAAEADGWIAAPQAMVDEIRNPRAPDVVVWLAGPAETSPDRLIVSTSPAAPDRRNLRFTACAVVPGEGAEGPDRGRLPAMAQRRLGLEQIMMPVWLYTGSGPFTDESALMMEGNEAMDARAVETPLYMLSLMQEPYFGLLRMAR